MRHQLKLLNRFSVKQTLGVITLVAVLFALLRYIRIDNGTAYAFLLAPTIVYLTLRFAAIALYPCLWLSRNAGAAIAIAVLAWLLITATIEVRASIALLLIAAVWMPQVAIATVMEGQFTRGKREAEFADSIHRDDWNGVILAGVCVLLIVAILCLSLYGISHHVVGKGCLFGKYWMLVGSGQTTEFQWQEGYSDIPWSWTHGAGWMSPASNQRDWQILGLERYRIGRIEKLRIPHWLPIAMLLIWPLAWGLPRLSELRRLVHESGSEHRR